MISPATIEEIKNHVDIIEVVGDYVTLKRSGSSYKALSPFSTEKTPSFYVVPSKGIFKDFSSGKGGDAITFLMEIDGLTYVEALKYLAQKYGIEIKEEEQSDEALEAQNRKESLFILMNFAKDHFQHLLWEEEEGKSIGLTYFRERGFTDESIKDFELGYSVEAWDHLLKTAEAKGYKRDLLEEAGLVVTKEGGKVYDRFRARVMFPIHNISGKVVAFGARMLGKDKKQPKYLNSPETELYNKSRVLYGLFQAKQEIRKEDRVYLVEGYTDVISMHQTGIKNVVSSSGTALTADQIKLIKRYTDNVTVIFDGDAAGIRASIRGIDMLLEGGLNVRAVALPDGEDPDSYARSLGATAFSHYIDEESQDIIRFKTKLFLKEASDDPVKRAALIKDIVRTITKIDDPVKRTVYLKECSDLLGISEQALVAEQNKLLIQKSQEQRKPNDRFDGPPPVQPQDMLIADGQEADQLDIVKVIELQERESARVLVNYGKSSIVTQEEVSEELLSYFLAEVEEIQFTNPVYKEILEIFKRKLSEGVIVDGDYLLDHGSEAVKREVVNLMTSRYEVSENWEKKFQIYIPKEQDHLKDITYSNILRLKFRIVQHLIAEENKKLKEATDIEEIDQLLDEIHEYKKIEMSIAQSLGNVTVK
ncbi:DNA primase [Marinoscillum furvescens]|uniref:DNA primase n=1 Tax=Marinoscillum furvescens DSM 4134 TaxID=1122208 RepID=A0A3D9L0B5_MARFU|nr:DNA primase [Marinoscillum furvescens]RED96184.1 DNA primase [Marinoscillum furvescens DSM 4134]